MELHGASVHLFLTSPLCPSVLEPDLYRKNMKNNMALQCSDKHKDLWFLPLYFQISLESCNSPKHVLGGYNFFTVLI